MTTPPLPVFSAPRRSRLWLWLTVAGVFVLIFFALLTVAVFRLANRFDKEYAPIAATLPAEIAGAKSEGLPMTVADLRPKPPVSDADNAAQTYRKLKALYQKQPKKEADADKAFLAEHLKVKVRTVKDDQEIRAFLKTHATELSLAEQAAQKPGCDFGRDWSKGFDTTFPELSAMRVGGRLLMAQAALESDVNQPIPALQDVTLAARIAHHAASDPNIISVLVKIAIQAVANRRFVEILKRYGDNPAIFPAAQKAAAALADPMDLRRAFSGEMVVSRISIQSIKASNVVNLSGVKFPANVQAQQQMKEAWESRMIANWRNVQRQLLASKGDSLGFERDLIGIQAEEETHRQEAGYELNAILNPVFVKIPPKIMQEQTAAHLRNDMIALLEYKQKLGKFPNTLNDLPKTPDQMDPFTNQPLHYRKTEKGFVLYSVSNNRKDDGGSEKLEAENWPEDIVVSYP